MRMQPGSNLRRHGQTGGHRGGASLARPKSTVIGKPVRERDRDHLRFVAAQPCLVCGRTPSDPHHIKFAEQRAMGRKVSDRFTVPICRLHHRELHRRGDERAWWGRQGIDPLPIAAALWERTHAVAAAAQLAGDMDRPTNLNGEHLADGWAPPSSIKLTKRSQLFARRQNDLLPANRGQPPQCAAEHRSRHRRGQETSRQNAVRHGLTAETVIDALEDAEDYAAFEMAVTADYDAQSAVERELVLRLASLLWRLRRATAIESGLFKIQAKQLLQFRQRRQAHQKRQEIIDGVYRNALATEEDMHAG